MKLKIKKWGNSAAIRLPSSLLKQISVSIGDSFNAEVAERVLTLRVTKPRYKLADLIAEMPDGLPRTEGWDEMPAVGREII